jgi:hypothetical protein
MNKRIEELKAQARDFYLDRDDLTCSVQELHRLVEEKFAELIILECIKVMVKNDFHGEWLGEKIKDHFGVE